MNANFTRQAAIATFLATALLAGCASVELSADGTGASYGNTQDDVLQRMASDSDKG